MSHLGFLCLVFGCFAATAATPTSRPKVITTVLPVYCVAANVAGEAAQVSCILGEGGDAHDYQLTPRHRSAIERAQLVLFNGLGLEPWLDKVIGSVRSRVVVADLSAGLESDLLPNLADGHGESPSTGKHLDHPKPGQRNPHVWLDPKLMSQMVTNALRAFERIDPANAQQYTSNALGFVQRLAVLDRTLEEGLKPFQQVAMVTYHDAFPYFARRYGLKIVGVIEEIPDVDPTPRHLSQLRQTIRVSQVRAIFVEPRHSARVAHRMGQDMNVPVEVLDTLETGDIRPDAYERGMRANLESIRKAFR